MNLYADRICYLSFNKVIVFSSCAFVIVSFRRLKEFSNSAISNTGGCNSSIAIRNSSSKLIISLVVISARSPIS